MSLEKAYWQWVNRTDKKLEKWKTSNKKYQRVIGKGFAKFTDVTTPVLAPLVFEPSLKYYDPYKKFKLK